MNIKPKPNWAGLPSWRAECAPTLSHALGKPSYIQFRSPLAMTRETAEELAVWLTGQTVYEVVPAPGPIYVLDLSDESLELELLNEMQGVV